MTNAQISADETHTQALTIKTEEFPHALYEEVLTYGYCHVKGFEGKISQLLRAFGHICMTTDVVINNTTQALVTSDRPLALHTDHSRVEFIAWQCIQQSSIGGETRLLDGRKVLDSMSVELRKELTKIRMFEHHVFKRDSESSPLLSYKKGVPSIYYSFWLADDNQKQTRCFQAFINEIASKEELLIRLQPNDMLIIDNRRMLHGRTAILGDKNRFLRRYWISEQKLEVK